MALQLIRDKLPQVGRPVGIPPLLCFFQYPLHLLGQKLYSKADHNRFIARARNETGCRCESCVCYGKDPVGNRATSRVFLPRPKYFG